MDCNSCIDTFLTSILLRSRPEEFLKIDGSLLEEAHDHLKTCAGCKAVVRLISIIDESLRKYAGTCLNDSSYLHEISDAVVKRLASEELADLSKDDIESMIKMVSSRKDELD